MREAAENGRKSPRRSTLTAAFVRTVNTPGKYGDVHGLILRVRPSGSKQWIWRGTVRGRRVDLGLGGYPYTTLAEARDKAFDYRKLARDGGDPRTLAAGAQNGVPTFRDAVEKVIEIHRVAWRGGKNEAQWRSSLSNYAYPRIGRMRVDDVTTTDVMAVLLPIWNVKRVTAKRVRQRIGAVMKWAVAQGYRTDNPAGEAIGAALPRGGARTKHFKALPHSEVAQAIATIRATDSWPPGKAALEFQILTAARPGEVRAADWSEIDVENRVWTIPAKRAKSGREHRVPLVARAIEVLEEARLFSHGSGLIFPSVTGRMIHGGTLPKLLARHGIKAVPHGFRSSFRDWCGETGQAREVAEAALAHVVKNQVEAAYARSDLFERRRELMEAWAEYVSSC